MLSPEAVRLILIARRIYKKANLKRIFLAIGASSLFYLALKFYKWYKDVYLQKKKILNRKVKPTNSNKASTIAINKQFFKELIYLLKIMFPRIFSKEMAILSLHSASLVSRTFLSIYVAKLEGSLVRNIVQKNFKMFAKYLMQWLLLAFPATGCNSLIRVSKICLYE
jgi:hypothetical protein